MVRNSEALKDLRVLVVEDEILIAEELRERLTQNGLRIVDVVDSGERAIQVVEQDHPELVLMDIRLKGRLDGIQTAEAIRPTMRGPVIFLTAHSDQDTLQRAKGTEPFGFVVKPFNERELVVAIEMSLHRYGLEKRLKESEQRYAATLASIGDGVIATDPEGRVTFMNHVAEALTQWRFADARGRTIDEVFPLLVENSQEKFENPALRAMRLNQKVTLNEPVEMIMRNQELIPIDDSAAPIIDEKGKLLGAVVAFRDIRQHRLAQDALRKAEDQLRQAQKLEAIGQLAGGVAHDFNNLITVINGFADLLLSRDSLDGRSRTLVKEIRKSGDRASSLTRQLLAFSCKQVLHPVTLQLDELITNISRMVERLIGEDMILTITSGPDLWAIWADPGQIEQVILNLTANARDAMPNGGQIIVETSNIEVMEEVDEAGLEIPAGPYVRLSVCDTGTGIDQETQEHIFEPFTTTKQPGEGTGLGLASVYGIVKQSGGFISFSTEIGKGTTFTLYFPAMPSVVPKKRGESLDDEMSLSGTETILVVEDDDSVRSLIVSGLCLHGYTVFDAKNGEEAVRLFTEHADNIQMVVTDVVMPVMSGREVAERVHLINPKVRWLYISGYTDDKILRHGVLKGEAALLQKPFTLEMLAKKVREILNQ
ncbi:response regulator [Candidatus Nitronereus thalassa]|uniref:histidine kinase n=1 Tax=Candidatus Nitronereus thalassa TaxID=3020898 RepID=A0ABU3K3R1_9BACT|nr:response regulator [Candidatus Nitronereus thalassa]MDT7041029.1 response regulator [Candidatus Nitronereus thalassa]